MPAVCAHTHTHAKEYTGSTVREPWVRMPAQFWESQLPQLQNGQHCSTQRALRSIRKLFPEQGHLRSPACPGVAEGLAEGDPGHGTAHTVTRGWHF